MKRIILIAAVLFTYISVHSLQATNLPADSLKLLWLAKNTKTIHYNNGLYAGHVFLGLKHGYGVLKYNNGDMYKGYWFFNKKGGSGALTYANGEVYNGAWKKDKMNGYGKLTTADTVFAGMWVNNTLINSRQNQPTQVNSNQMDSDLSHNQGSSEISPSENTDDKTPIKKETKTNPVIVTTTENAQRRMDTLMGSPSFLHFGTKYVIYNDNNRYEGKLLMGKKSGDGKMYYSNRNVYEGLWKKDIRAGGGKLNTPDGTEYSGIWNDEKGYGTIKYIDGKVYEGDWDSLRRVGAAIMKYPNGDIFQGTWINDVIEGFGVLKFADSTIYSYEGTWKNNQRNGVGTLKFDNGRKFVGNFVNGKREGKGVIFDQHGNVEIECNWKNDERVLEAITVRYINGDVYNGYLDSYEGGSLNFKKRNGYGIMEYADLKSPISYKSKQRYMGDWKNNQPHGKGIQYYDEQAYFDGNWVNGQRHGTGVLYFANGSKLQGVWENDKFTGEIPFGAMGDCYNGYGIKKLSNGAIYEGFWKNVDQNGYGKMFLNDGSIHEGNWANNKIEGRATITTQKGTTEIVRRNNRDIVIKKDSVYVSLDYALIDTENVEYLKLTNDDTKNTNFSSISKMQNLKGLTLTTTKSLSEILAIFDIPYLKYLHIQFISSSKETDSLPKQIGNLVYLEELELEGHRYAQIPKEISMLQVLKICNLIGQNNDETNALIIPDEFWSLSNLKELYLNGNKIKSLSKSIQNLTQLEILSLKENNLKTLPDEIGYLTKLKSLSLFHNNLSSLPSELGQLTQLEHLDISHNNLSNIPSSLCNLPNNYNTTIDLRMNSIGQSAANKLIQCLQKANVKY